MKKYEILEHTADLKIKVFGKTKEELFSNALFGMTESMRPEKEISGKTKRKIEIRSSDLAALLVDFLSEVLYLTQVNKEIYLDIKFKKLSDTQLEAKLLGQKAKSFEEDIKAVTYHDLDVRQKEDNNWEAIVLFDI